MASVTQCDACGNVVKHEQSVCIKAINVNSSGSITQCIWRKDLCTECYNKICRLVKEVPTDA